MNIEENIREKTKAKTTTTSYTKIYEPATVISVLKKEEKIK